MGKQIASFSQNKGGLHRLKAELQRHRKVRWIHDDNSSAGDVGLHTALAHGALDLADAALDLRISSGFLMLLPNFLFRHFESLVPASPLHDIVEASPRHHEPCSIQ